MPITKSGSMGRAKPLTVNATPAVTMKRDTMRLGVIVIIIIGYSLYVNWRYSLQPLEYLSG